MSENASPRHGRRLGGSHVSGSISLVVGGILITLWPLVSNETIGGYSIILSMQFLGFALLLLGAILIGVGSNVAGMILLVAAASLALFGWTWFLHIGLFLHAPIWGWSAAASLLFLCAGVVYLASGQRLLGVVSLLFFMGYLFTAFIAISNPVWPPLYTDLPTAGSAITSGIVMWIMNLTPQRSAAESQISRYRPASWD